jgi:hypothetical protein
MNTTATTRAAVDSASPVPNELISIGGAPRNAGSSHVARNSSDCFENGRLSTPPTIESAASASSGMVIVAGDSCGSGIACVSSSASAACSG